MCGVRTPQNQVYPLIYLPADIANGDPFFSQDSSRDSVHPGAHERVNLSLIAEAFNIFNIANLTGYGSGLNALCRSPDKQQHSDFRTAE